MKRSRVIAAAVALFSGAVAVASFAALYAHIAEYQEEHQFLQPIFRHPSATEFEFAGRPVRIADDVDETGAGVVTVRYGDDEVTFPVAIPQALDLPFYPRHEDWLTVQRFAEPPPNTSLSEFGRRVEQGLEPERLVVITRTPNPGENRGAFGIDVPDRDWGYGEVMRKHWTFDFYELLPEGGIRHETRTFPESERSFQRRVAEAEREGLPRPERDPRELRERTWQYYAALKVMPPGAGPKQSFADSALEHAGWALPVAAFSGLVCFVALGFAFAPTRERHSRFPDAAPQG